MKSRQPPSFRWEDLLVHPSRLRIQKYRSILSNIFVVNVSFADHNRLITLFLGATHENYLNWMKWYLWWLIWTYCFRILEFVFLFIQKTNFQTHLEERSFSNIQHHYLASLDKTDQMVLYLFVRIRCSRSCLQILKKRLYFYTQKTSYCASGDSS